MLRKLIEAEIATRAPACRRPGAAVPPAGGFDIIRRRPAGYYQTVGGAGSSLPSGLPLAFVIQCIVGDRRQKEREFGLPVRFGFCQDGLDVLPDS
jgi:hypothetical protein